MLSEQHIPGQFETLLADERARLVQLCMRLAGNGDAAEDLAQETLVEAWRHRHKLVDCRGAPAWLSAIARNVCLRWRRRDARERRRRASLEAGAEQSVLEALPDPVDIHHPAVRAFWRTHPRVRVIPPREVEVDGRAALVTGVTSMDGSASIDLVAVRDTLEIVAVYGAVDAKGP